MRTKSAKKNKINVVTLGCSKNIYDSEVLMGQLKASDKDVVHEQQGNIVVDRDKILTADEALEYGLIDQVLNTRKSQGAASPVKGPEAVTAG